MDEQVLEVLCGVFVAFVLGGVVALVWGYPALLARALRATGPTLDGFRGAAQLEAAVDAPAGHAFPETAEQTFDRCRQAPRRRRRARQCTAVLHLVAVGAAVGGPWAADIDQAAWEAALLTAAFGVVWIAALPFLEAVYGDHRAGAMEGRFSLVFSTVCPAAFYAFAAVALGSALGVPGLVAAATLLVMGEWLYRAGCARAQRAGPAWPLLVISACRDARELALLDTWLAARWTAIGPVYVLGSPTLIATPSGDRRYALLVTTLAVGSPSCIVAATLAVLAVGEPRYAALAAGLAPFVLGAIGYAYLLVRCARAAIVAGGGQLERALESGVGNGLRPAHRRVALYLLHADHDAALRYLASLARAAVLDLRGVEGTGTVPDELGRVSVPLGRTLILAAPGHVELSAGATAETYEPVGPHRVEVDAVLRRLVAVAHHAAPA